MFTYIGKNLFGITQIYEFIHLGSFLWSVQITDSFSNSVYIETITDTDMNNLISENSLTLI